MELASRADQRILRWFGHVERMDVYGMARRVLMAEVSGGVQKCITGTQTFLISKLGGWKYTTAFHKSSKTNRHQALKHLRQYGCYGNWSVIGNREGSWTFRNWSDIALSPASLETTQMNKPPKHCTKTGAITSAVLFRKRGNIPNGSVPP